MNATDILGAVEFWHWWVFAVVLIVLEIFAPTTVFLWMGVSAGFVGVALWLFPMGWEYQWLLFAVAAVVSAVAWRVYLTKHPTRTTRPTLNRRGEQLIGRSLTLSEPIIDGVGKVRINDTAWKIAGPDMPKGTRVTIAGVQGTVLRVEKA